MSGKEVRRNRYVLGPDGRPITLADLPSGKTLRWTPLRKAIVVAAVQGGLITLDDARARYGLTVEEFLAWQDALGKFGVAGLQTTHLLKYRS